jgi:adenylosuccinate lyase
VLSALGLRVDPVSTQIVQRDRHAAIVAAIAITGGTLERFATEIRNLQHTEIDEVREPFRSGQAGSSAMPQKRNPVKSERIAGLARILRGYAAAAAENQALWHERDMSHSSAERILLPDATGLIHYALRSMHGIIDGLEVNRDAMRRNLDAGLGLHAASRLLTALVNAGAPRDQAYALVQGATAAARAELRPLADVARATREITALLDEREIVRALDERAALAHCGLLVDRLKEIETNS